MKRMTITLIFSVIGLLSQTFAQGPGRRRRTSVSHFIQHSHDEYYYPQCQQFNKEEETNYTITCDEGFLNYHPIDTSLMAKIEGLNKPSGALLVSTYKRKDLEDLKEFVLSKLKERTMSQTERVNCFISHMNAQNGVTGLCKQEVMVLRKTTQETYPLLRKNMAIMQGISRDGKVDRDIEHPHNIQEVEKLSIRETDEVEKVLKERLDQEKENFREKFSVRHNCSSPEKLALNSNLRLSRYCLDRIRNFENRHMIQFRQKLEQQAKENYERILNEAPFLSFIEKGEIEKGSSGPDPLIISALRTMSRHSQVEYNKWKDKDPKEFKEFFKYPNIINEFISGKTNSPNEFLCDAFEGYHRMYGPGGTKEILQTVGIVTAAIVGGGLCAMTAGLGCAVAVAMGTEAIAVGTSQFELDQAIKFTQSGLTTSQVVREAEERRNTDLLLAPLSFVGLGVGRSIAVAAERGTIRGGARSTSKTLMDDYLQYNPTTASDNLIWMSRARRSSPGLFLDVENAALKRLNDTLGDKNLVTALTNLHKDILFNKMYALKRKYPSLKILKYSDFKSSRFSFEGDIPPNLESEIAEIFNSANQEFAQRLANRADISLPDREKPSFWFNGGIGASADQAGLAARHARRSSRGGLQIIHLNAVREQVKTSMSAIETQRQRVSGFLSKYPQFLEGAKNQEVPSPVIFEVLRKVKGTDPSELSQLLNTRFNVSLSADQAADLLDYSKKVDQFSPGFWIESRVVANLDEANHGGFSVDFKGMGARNVSQVAKDLAASGNDVDLAIRTIRKGEGVVTQQFDEAKAGFQGLVSQTLKDLKIPVKTQCSGDDCVSIPTARLPDVAKERMMEAIAKTENPSGYRLSFIPPNVVRSDRSVVAVHGELVEKKVRKSLTGFGEKLIPPKVLDRVTFALDMPKSLGKGEIKLLVKPADGVELSVRERKLIEENLAPAIYKVNKEIAEETGKSIQYSHGGVHFY